MEARFEEARETADKEKESLKAEHVRATYREGKLGIKFRLTKLRGTKVSLRNLSCRLSSSRDEQLRAVDEKLQKELAERA